MRIWRNYERLGRYIGLRVSARPQAGCKSKHRFRPSRVMTNRFRTLRPTSTFRRSVYQLWRREFVNRWTLLQAGNVEGRIAELPEHSRRERLVLLVVVHDPPARQGNILARVAAHQLGPLALKGHTFSRQALLSKPWRSFGHCLHDAFCTIMPAGNQLASRLGGLRAESRCDVPGNAPGRW